jgi:hypothetical protein
MKDYQSVELDATIPLQANVRLAMDDIAGTMREGLLAMAVSAGLGVMGALMEESVTALCRPKGKHQPGRAAMKPTISSGDRRAATIPRISHESDSVMSGLQSCAQPCDYKTSR